MDTLQPPYTITLALLGGEGGSLKLLQHVTTSGDSHYELRRNSVLLHQLLDEEQDTTLAAGDDSRVAAKVTSVALEIESAAPEIKNTAADDETASSLTQLHRLLLTHRYWSKLALLELHPSYAAHFLALIAQHAPTSLPRFTAIAAALAESHQQ